MTIVRPLIRSQRCLWDREVRDKTRPNSNTGSVRGSGKRFNYALRPRTNGSDASTISRIRRRVSHHRPYTRTCRHPSQRDRSRSCLWPRSMTCAWSYFPGAGHGRPLCAGGRCSGGEQTSSRVARMTRRAALGIV